jgi:cytochrome P450
MLTISFATRTDSTLDPLTERALALTKEFMELTGRYIYLSPLQVESSDGGRFPGALSNIIDFIKPLQWIPTTTRSRGHRLHDEIVEVYGAMIDRVKARMNAGEDVPDCLVKTMILTQEQEKLSWEDMCMLSVVFTLGGVHSVRSMSSKYGC